MTGAELLPASSWWARALLPGEGTGPTAPAWAVLADRAVAGAPVAPVPATGSAPAGGRAGAEARFAAVVAPFVELALPAATDAPGIAPSAVTDVRRSLTALLCRIATRTLVAQLHRARADGRLGAGDPAAQFDRFVTLTASAAGLADLVARHPVLARLLATTATHHADAFAELADRLVADRVAIVDGLLAGVDAGPVVHVRAGAGDTHHHGRSVAVLQFADGRRVVYKPRPMAAHPTFAALLDQLRDHAGDDVPRSAAVVARPGHGWMEYVEARPCATPADVDLFYRRQGLLLAALHAVRATDMHCENLVAAGAHPVPVDLETLLHPDADGAGSAADTDPARTALGRSVLRSAMLPQWRDGADLSGFGGDRAPLPSSMGGVVGYADAGLSTMRLVRQVGEYPGADNRPVLDGRVVEPAAHVDAVLAGFRAGYDALIAVRASLIARDGVLATLASRSHRVVRRDSAVYARLLDECTHPDVLVDAASRDAVLRRLATQGPSGTHDPAVVDDEVAQLWHGDIPVFAGDPREVATAAHETVAALSVVDRERQAWIIAVALAGRRPVGPAGALPAVRRRGPAHRIGRPPAPLAAAAAIGDRLIADAVTTPVRSNWWCAYRHLDGTASALPMGADLGQGHPGVALFLAELAGATGRRRYHDHAARAAAPLPALLSRLAADDDDAALVGPGLYDGLGGIAHALSRLAILLPSAGLESARDVAVELTRRSARGHDLSVRSGLAGGVLAMLGVAATGHAGATTVATELAARLLTASAAASGPHRRSVLHGSLGIVWVLARAGRDLGDAALTAGAVALLDRLDRLHPALTASAVRGGACFDAGTAGVALVHDAVDPHGFLARRLRQRLATVRPAPGDDSLGSGAAGLLDVGLLLTPGAPALADLACHVAARALDDPDGVGCSTPGGVRTGGLLHGWAGVGLVLLRHHDPAGVPSPITLVGSAAPAHVVVADDRTCDHPSTGGMNRPPRGMFL